MKSFALAFQAVVSPSLSPGRDGMYQPLMTGFTKPASTKASRSSLLSSFVCKTVNPLSCRLFNEVKALASRRWEGVAASCGLHRQGIVQYHS